MTYEQIVQEIENIFEALQDIFIAALIRFGPYVVASMPATFTGTSVSKTHGGLIGWIVGVALEVTVLLAVYAASSLYDQGLMSKFWFMVWLFPFYFVGVGLAILYPTATGLGLIAPILTIICYIAGMFIREADKNHKRMIVKDTEEKQAQAELDKSELEHKHELERLALEQKHTEKMARIEAKKDAKSIRNKPMKKRISKIEQKQMAINFVSKNSQISGAELGRKIGVSDRTGQHLLNDLADAGLIHKNGDGWKVN